MRSKSKTNRGLLTRRRFPAPGTDHMSVASSSDWFVALFVSVVIGSSASPFVCRNGSDYAPVYAFKYELDSSRVGALYIYRYDRGGCRNIFFLLNPS